MEMQDGYIDNEKKKPTRAAMYRIIIMDAETGLEREARADYRMQSGSWLPIADFLRDGDYVKAWKPVDGTTFEPLKGFKKDGAYRLPFDTSTVSKKSVG
ncbi:MAG: hypothetical protein ACSHXF_09830 [Aquaticitalea sp.]